MTKNYSIRITIILIILFLAIFLSCTPPPAHKPDNTISYNLVEKIDADQKEIQGYCVIKLSDKSIKTRLMATCINGKIDAVLMDELGVPLTVIAANDSSMKLARYFPPVTEKYGNLFGLAITSYFRSIRISLPQKGIVQDTSFKNVASSYYFTDTAHDSTIIYQQKNIYSLLSEDSSFSLLNNDKDSVCHCVWE